MRVFIGLDVSLAKTAVRGRRQRGAVAEEGLARSPARSTKRLAECSGAPLTELASASPRGQGCT